ncbi:MAG: protein translocase subunit SecF, partial [Gammaproteobacteria bacterium]
TPNFDFVGKRRVAGFVSLVLVVGSIALIAFRGLNMGLDFTGGTLVELEFPQPAEIATVREQLAKAGFTEAVVQHFGTSHDVLIRLPATGDTNSASLSTRILAALPEAEMRRVEFVGPQVGDELTEQGGLAMLYALIGILIYVAIRFQSKFAPGAVIALVHDVSITLGVFSAAWMEFDLPTLAAILAVIGYSLNDTIVVYDRIRENFRRMRKSTAEQIVNTSLNQTLSRTLMTSLTTLLVVACLFFLGGEMIHDFAAALLIGIVVGTYSSIYVASSITLALGISKEDLMPVKKEGADLDALP